MIRWWLIALLAGSASAGGCATGTGSIDDRNRLGLETAYVTTPDFGAPRGRHFEDIIPFGARISAVHANVGPKVNAIWIEFERNGVVKQTPRRGGEAGRHEVLKLGKSERIIGIQAYGKGSIDELIIATDLRTKSFGGTAAQGADPQHPAPWFDQLTPQQRASYTGIGFTGRADAQLRQISLRIQVKE